MMKLTCAASAALMVCTAHAQIVVPPNADPGALQQRRIDEEQRRQELERLERKPVTEPVIPPPAAPAAVPLASSVRFTVQTIRFEPASEIFTAEELKARAGPLEGKEVGLAELQQLVEQINAAYRERGVITARALIPRQDVTAGVFTIQLVEGRVGAINITGNSATRESYIRSRLDAETGRLVNLPALQESLMRFNRTNDTQLRAELKPGQAFGRTDVDIGVVEPDQHVFRVGVDNFGSEATGETRLGLGYTNRSLLGWRDSLNLGSMTASGLTSYSVDYGIPVGAAGRLNLAHNQDDTDLKHGPFASLGITGQSKATSLSLRQPVAVDERAQTDLLLSLRQRDAENRVSGVFLSSTATDDVQLGVDHQATDASGQWGATYSLYNGKATTAGIAKRYTVGRGAIRRTHFLADGWAVRGALSLQHTSSDELPSGEYFFLGGEGSVRGYPVGVFSGDKGTLLSLELQHPISAPAGPDQGSGLMANGFFFVDAGNVKTVRPPESTLPASESLRSVGWGVNLYMGPRVSARVTLAYALTRLPDEPKRTTVRFQLNGQF